MLRPSHSLLGHLALLIKSCSAVNLYVAETQGNVTSLSLTGSGNNYSLSITHKTADCDARPSWLSLDCASRVLYCLDRGADDSVYGSLNAFSVNENGALARISRVVAPLSVVSGEILRTSSGARAYISASFNKSAAAVFTIGENGILPDAGPSQLFFPTLDQPGPVASRQDRSYLHQVLIDPTGNFVLFNDIGADRGRVYTYNNLPDARVGPLTEFEGLVTDPGTGPRHGFFRTMANGDVFYFFCGELSQKVYSYRVDYSGKNGLGFTKVFEVPAIDGSLPANTAPTSEIVMTPDSRFLIVSNREKSFEDSTIYQSGPSDTLSTFAIHEDGTLSLVQLAPSGGWSPRHFSINKAGSIVAVGHQKNKTVVLWKRDVESGRIVLEEEGGKIGQVKLTGSVVVTIWDE